jgi:hypothetical protein
MLIERRLVVMSMLDIHVGSLLIDRHDVMLAKFEDNGMIRRGKGQIQAGRCEARPRRLRVGKGRFIQLAVVVGARR